MLLTGARNMIGIKGVHMDTTILNNGMEMPLVGLGTWDLHGKECIDTVSKAISLGYHLIDTAQMYKNEVEVGRGIARSNVPRSELFITTKIYRISNSYEKAKKAINESLHRLKLEYVDLLLLHEPYPQEVEMYHALEEALQAGKTRAIGISNYDEKRYSDFIRQVTVIPAINQLEAHVYYQKWDFQKIMEQTGTKMQAWAPLAQGIDRIVEHPVLIEIGKNHCKCAAQVALRFLVQRGRSVIPKSKHENRLAENIDLFDFALSEDEITTIKSLDRNETLFAWTKTF